VGAVRRQASAADRDRVDQERPVSVLLEERNRFGRNLAAGVSNRVSCEIIRIDLVFGVTRERKPAAC